MYNATFITAILIIFTVLNNRHKNAKYHYFYKNTYRSKRNINKLRTKRLNASRTRKKLKTILNNNMPRFCFLVNIIKESKFYLSLSKFTDYKINSNKTRYRIKYNHIFIEKIASTLVSKFKITNSPTIFKNYNLIKAKVKIRKKEEKVLKLLITKYLLLHLFGILNKLYTLDKIIQNAKKRKVFKLLKNDLYTQAELYGIIKYNPNYTYFREKYNIDNLFNFDLFFNYINHYKQALNNTTHYLKIMFN